MQALDGPVHHLPQTYISTKMKKWDGSFSNKRDHSMPNKVICTIIIALSPMKLQTWEVVKASVSQQRDWRGWKGFLLLWTVAVQFTLDRHYHTNKCWLAPVLLLQSSFISFPKLRGRYLELEWSTWRQKLHCCRLLMHGSENKATPWFIRWTVHQNMQYN